MKIIIIRENENEKSVDLDFSFKKGTLRINFSPDFIGEEIKIYDDKLVFKSSVR